MPFHIYWQGHHDEDVFYYDNLTLKNSNVEEILGVTICVVKQVKN